MGRFYSFYRLIFFCVIAKIPDQEIAVSPVLLHLHPQLEIDMPLQQFLDLRARHGTDLLEHRAAFSDDDALVRIPFADDRGIDVNDLLPVLHGFDRHMDIRLPPNCTGEHCPV